VPDATTTINREQRDALYEFLIDQLSRLADLPLAIKHEEYPTAKRLGREFGQYFRLLDDLGWGSDGRAEVALSMPTVELADALARLRADAKGALDGSADERESRELDEEYRQRHTLVFETSSELLVELTSGRGGDSA
jgi:hypothetical protein